MPLNVPSLTVKRGEGEERKRDGGVRVEERR